MKSAMDTRCSTALDGLHKYLTSHEQLENQNYHRDQQNKGTYYSGFEYGVNDFKRHIRSVLSDCDMEIRIELEETANWLLEAVSRDELPQSRGLASRADTGIWHKGVADFSHYMWNIVDAIKLGFDAYSDVAILRHWIIDTSRMATLNSSYKSEMKLQNNKSNDGEYEAEFIKMNNGKVSVKVYRYFYSGFDKKPQLWGEFLVDGKYISGYVSNIFFF